MYHCEMNAILFFIWVFAYFPIGLNHLGSLASPAIVDGFDVLKLDAFDLRTAWDVDGLLSLPNFEFNASEYCFIPL